MSYGQGDPRVYLLEHRDRAARDRRQFPRHDLRAALLARRPARDHEPAAGRQRQPVTMDLRSKQTTRLTDTPAIDTAPCYSPDGKCICFESDRGGTQQIYVMSATGGPAQRISFGEGHHSTPVWSPRGDYIAFTGQARRAVLDRHHQAGRLGRAHPHARLPQRRADLRAEWPRHHVLPRPRARGRTSSRSTSPAATSCRNRRRASPPIRPGRRCCRDAAAISPFLNHEKRYTGCLRPLPVAARFHQG